MTAPSPRPLPRLPRAIRIVPIGDLDREIVDRLRSPLAERFLAPVEPGEPLEPRRHWHDAERDQLHGDLILDALIERQTAGEWTLGIVDADLFTPGLTFIFGQATVGGCCAVIGTARLRPEFHDEGPDLERFHQRVLTEAVHELGHIAGLDHCPDPLCVMHFSSTLADTDRKGPDFCTRCQRTRAADSPYPR